MELLLGLEAVDLCIENLDLLRLNLLPVLVQGLVGAETLLFNLLEGGENLVFLFDQVFDALDELLLLDVSEDSPPVAPSRVLIASTITQRHTYLATGARTIHAHL